MTNAIILCAGKMKHSTLPIYTNRHNALIPVNGKPVIGWIIDDLIVKNILTITIVTRSNSRKIKSYINNAYGEIININIVSSSGKTIIHSLNEGISSNGIKSPALVILGDTLIKDTLPVKYNDYVFVGKVEDSERWCVVKTNEAGVISQYLEKEDTHSLDKKFALSGYYFFKDSELLKSCVESAIKRNKENLSDVLTIYGGYRNIFVVQAKKWFDFGNIENLLLARKTLFLPRYFNSILIDDLSNMLCKKSTNIEKLENEYLWYMGIPTELQPLVPRVFSLIKTKKIARLKLEFYGYPTLSELFLFSDLNVESWQIIIRKLFSIQNEFKKYKCKLESDQLTKMYYEKTIERVEEIKSISSLSEIVFKDQIILNGKKILGYPLLKEKIHKYSEKISKKSNGCIIHGDYCFSNILYDFPSQIVKLIDPRGSFGKRGIYGDPRYDLAKLRHSIHGGYDYINANLFNLTNKNGKYYGKIFFNKKNNRNISDYCDLQITKYGYKINEIIFIEGLLFLSMIPLHNDHPKKQIMYYLRGLEILNSVLL